MNISTATRSAARSPRDSEPRDEEPWVEVRGAPARGGALVLRLGAQARAVARAAGHGVDLARRGAVASRHHHRHPERRRGARAGAALRSARARVAEPRGVGRSELDPRRGRGRDHAAAAVSERAGRHRGRLDRAEQVPLPRRAAPLARGRDPAVPRRRAAGGLHHRRRHRESGARARLGSRVANPETDGSDDRTHYHDRPHEHVRAERRRHLGFAAGAADLADDDAGHGSGARPGRTGAASDGNEHRATMRQLFGTDGIRGKARLYPLDSATMYALGEALAHRLRGGPAILPAPRVLLGMDTRESGPEIARALSAGMAAGGAEAVLIGVIPTPGAAYLCRTTDAAAAISISASHNPFEDNGVKIFGHDGMKLPDAIEEQIEDELRALRREDVTIDGTPLP